MQIHIGSDHAGLELKAALIAYLQTKGHKVTDHGPYQFDAVDDYPDFCIPAAIATVADSSSLGIVLGGSGNGEQIAANKSKVRAQFWLGAWKPPNWGVNTTMQMLLESVGACTQSRIV